MPNLLKAVEKVDDMTVRFVLNHPEAPFLANLGMDFASIFSAEYAQAMQDAGTLDKVDLEPVGTGPFQLVAYQKDAVIRYKANPDYWAGQGGDRRLWCSRSRPTPSVRWQKLQAGECHVMPYPNPADLDAMRANPDVNAARAGGPQRRLPGLQHAEEAVRRQARAPGAQHGDQQGRDHRCGLPGLGQGGEEPDPADHLVVQRRGQGLPLRSRGRQEAARGGRRHQPQDQHLGDAGAAARTTPTPGGWPS